MTADARDRTTGSRSISVALTEDEILRRGLDTFAELGYEATTVRELARRLKVSHNFVNDRYGSKARFWRAVVDAAMRERGEELKAVIGELPDEELLVATVTRFYRAAAQTPDVNRLVADESVRDSDRLDYLHEHFIEPFWAGIRPTVERLMATGRMPRTAMDMVFFAITGPALAMTHEPLAYRLGRSRDWNVREREESAEAMANLVMRGLLPHRS
ncbi:TetR family transcriptional regulator [Actinoplanes sp. ATCC 53533]|uniref:TetR/AcrR family transcriptional regulator n=1 Tax=Actinoplanes sp. ATCC 53533 TaxID=1288362 RepID=UPI000F793CD1|nr:TetR/AcrR family transcriptional regulator [Actinoplanes sp. ATCC 53533]RSM56766.1 TetR family transcriptional regulator [Actinoplanes sp. ATCC 53533]